ncbi:MAG TPA: hypothetical protein VJI12_03975 [archaeon]|nr:hypothetical protein [archaeon]
MGRVLKVIGLAAVLGSILSAGYMEGKDYSAAAMLYPTIGVLSGAAMFLAGQSERRYRRE